MRRSAAAVAAALSFAAAEGSVDESGGLGTVSDRLFIDASRALDAEEQAWLLGPGLPPRRRPDREARRGSVASKRLAPCVDQL